MESRTQAEEMTGQENAHFLHWPGRKRRRNGYRGQEVGEVWLVQGVLASWLLFSIECAGWELTWGFKDSREKCGGVP